MHGMSPKLISFEYVQKLFPYVLPGSLIGELGDLDYLDSPFPGRLDGKNHFRLNQIL